jgi:hypothetical protein
LFGIRSTGLKWAVTITMVVIKDLLKNYKLVDFQRDETGTGRRIKY